jgi:hypothetical protein
VKQLRNSFDQICYTDIAVTVFRARDPYGDGALSSSTSMAHRCGKDKAGLIAARKADQLRTAFLESGKRVKDIL